MLVTTVSKAAAAGAALLDERRPGWNRGIDAANLDIRDGRRCVLGQLYGTFGVGLAELGFVDPATTPGQAAGFGFTVRLTEAECRASAAYAELTAAWRDEIARRRLAEISVPQESEVLVSV